MLVRGVRRLHGLDEQPVEVEPRDPLGDRLVEVAEVLGAPVVVALGLEVLVGEREVGVELLVVGAVGVGDLEVRRHLEVDVGAATGDQAVRRPLHQGADRPGEVVVERGDGDIGAGVGVVDRVDLVALHEHLAELNSQWKKALTIREIATVCFPADSERKPWLTAYRLCIGCSGRKSITIVSGPIERARAKWSYSTVAWRCINISPESSYAVCRSSLVVDPADAAPPAAVERLHVQRVAQLGGEHVEVEGLVVLLAGVGPAVVVDRVLVRHQDRRRDLEAEPDHRAVRRVLLHRLEREGAVEQVGAVDEGGLLQPLAGVEVPVGEPVDDQAGAHRVGEVERLDRQALAGEPVLGASTFSGPTKRRICSNACGQSSSAPSSKPIRWSFVSAMVARLVTERQVGQGSRSGWTSTTSMSAVRSLR